MSWDDEENTFESVTRNAFAGEDEDFIPDSWDADEEQTITKNSESVKKVEIAIKSKLLKKELKEKEMKKKEDNSLVTERDRENFAKSMEYELFKDSLEIKNDVNGIDEMQVKTKEDFEKFKELLKKKILPLEVDNNSSYYTVFLENLFRELVISSDVETLKKFSVMFSALANEKSKIQKTTKKKKTAKGTKLLTVRVDDTTNYDEEDNFEFDEEF